METIDIYTESIVGRVNCVLETSSKKIQDPDELIHDIAWKGIEEIKQITLSFPEDNEILNEYINKKASVYRLAFLSLIRITEPTKLRRSSYAVMCVKKTNWHITD